jgi:hypothetical protein
MAVPAILGGDQRAHVREVLLDGLAGAGGVRLDRRSADTRRRRELRQHRGEGDA